MTEKELTLLGMEKQEMSEFDGEENPDYYYSKQLVTGLDFITNAKSECKNEDWYVEFFDTNPSVRFYNFAEVQGLFNKIEKNIVKNES